MRWDESLGEVKYRAPTVLIIKRQKAEKTTDGKEHKSRDCKGGPCNCTAAPNPLQKILCKKILSTFERNALPLRCSSPIEFQVALTFNLTFNSIKHCDIQSQFEFLILPESDQLQDYLTKNNQLMAAS